MMELKIYSPQDTGFIQKIDWNYDELKKEIAAAIESYANSVYTDDMIKKAKEDRAKLNKVSDALKKERTRIRKKLSEGSEEILDSIRRGYVTYVINTRDINADSELDGYAIRRCAVENTVTMFTALDTVRVLLDVLEETTLCISTVDAD